MYFEPGIEATACACELLYVYVYVNLSLETPKNAKSARTNQAEPRLLFPDLLPPHAFLVVLY